MKNLLVVFSLLMATLLLSCKGSSGVSGSVSETSNSSNTTTNYKNIENVKTPQNIEPQGADLQEKSKPTVVPLNHLKNTSIKKDVPASK